MLFSPSEGDTINKLINTCRVITDKTDVVITGFCSMYVVYEYQPISRVGQLEAKISFELRMAEVLGNVTSFNDTVFDESVTSYSSRKPDTLFLGGVYLVTSVLVIVTNIIVVIVVSLSRDLHLPTLWNIAFMAACDSFVGLHFLVFAVPSAFLNRFVFSGRFLRVAVYSLALMYCQNCLNVTLASVDRYISVCWPLRYAHLMTSRRFLKAIIISSTLNSVCVLVQNGLAYKGTYDIDIAIGMPKKDSLSSALFSSVLPSLTVLLTFVLLLKIIFELSVAKRRAQASGQQVRKSSLTLMIVTSVVVFLMCYLPTCAGFIYGLITGSENVSGSYKRFAIICFMSNSLWNVAIYAVTFKPFRDAFLRLFCKRFYRKKRQRQVELEAQIERQENRDHISTISSGTV